MTTQHTPGPWLVTREGRDGREIIVRSSVEVPDEYDGGTYQPLVADLYRGGVGNIHDANLIAAAPELLAALQAFIDGGYDRETAITAIAKATGKTP